MEPCAYSLLPAPLPTGLDIPWIAFLLYWAIASIRAKKTVKHESFKTRAPIVALNLLVYILLFTNVFRAGCLQSTVVPHSPITTALSILLTWSGTAFAFWARHTIGRNWSATVTLKQKHELIANGPYAFVRHPIYTGFLTAILGTAIGIGELGSIIAFVVCVCTYVLKLKVEERLLTSHFGNQYEDYKKNTKALVPFVW